MATATWVGVAPGTFITNTNWSPANVPIDADILTCNRQNTQSIAGANHAGIRPASLKTERGWPSNIGSISDPLIIDFVEVVHRGLGTIYLKSDDNTSGEYTDHVIIDSPNDILAARLDGMKVDKITCLNGLTQLAPTLGTVAVPSRLIVGSRVNPMANPKVLISAKSGDTTNAMVSEAMQFSGLITSAGVITKLIMIGGRWLQTGEEIATLYQYGGYIGYGAEQTLGTIVEAHIFGGTFDTTYLARGITITDLHHYAGATIMRDPDLLTITTEHDHGGTIVNKRADVDAQMVQQIGGGVGIG